MRLTVSVTLNCIFLVAEFNAFVCLCDTELYISCAHVAEFNAFDCLCDTELCISCGHVAEFNAFDCLCDTETVYFLWSCSRVLMRLTVSVTLNCVFLVFM